MWCFRCLRNCAADSRHHQQYRRTSHRPAIASRSWNPHPLPPTSPANTPLYRVVQNHLETFIALCHNEWEEESIPPYAERALRRYLECGILAYRFACACCAECGHDFLVAFTGTLPPGAPAYRPFMDISCKGRGVCSSCNSRHMVETAAHLVDHVFSPLPMGIIFAEAAALSPATRPQGAQ